MSLIPDSPFGDRLRQRLTHEPTIWLVTVGPSGTPQPNPVWFLWDGADQVLIYNRTSARRLGPLAERSRVALHFDTDAHGGDVMVLTGSARVAKDEPPADHNPAYLAKYQPAIDNLLGSAAAFAADYAVAVRVRLERVRGF